MIVAKTYLKTGGNFEEFYSSSRKIKNREYIEGAIELTINDVSIIDKSMWDLVDQLWAYLTEGIECAAKGENFKTYFPDQSIEIDIQTKRDKVIIAVTCHTTVKVVVDKFEFVSSIKRLAIEFFEHLKSKGDKFETNADFYLNRLQAIDA